MAAVLASCSVRVAPQNARVRSAPRAAAASPRAAYRASGPHVAAPRAAPTTQRAALRGCAVTASGPIPLRWRRVAAQPAQAALSKLASGPPPAKAYAAAALGAAALALKLLWEARSGGGGLLLAAGYAMHAGSAYTIAAGGGSPGSDSLKRLNAGLVRATRMQMLPQCADNCNSDVACVRRCCPRWRRWRCATAAACATRNLPWHRGGDACCFVPGSQG